MTKYQLDPVLTALLNNMHTYLSGEKLAKELSISRAAIHKRIEKLRADGYHIEAQRGFLLKEPLPYHIIAEQISTDSSLPILFVKETPSTNALAKEILKTHEESFVLMTRAQTAGRGRMTRTWQMTPDHDIAMSFVYLTEGYPLDLLFSVIRLASLSVYQVLTKYHPDLHIKWPNDIITSDGKKVCGILTESILEDNQIRYLIIGIGININSTQLPEYADSMRDLVGECLPIAQIYSEIISTLSSLWEPFPLNKKFIEEEWEKHLAWKGQSVTLTYNDKEYQGIFKSVLEDGSLLLEIDSKKQRFLAGDLTQLKMRKI